MRNFWPLPEFSCPQRDLHIKRIIYRIAGKGVLRPQFCEQLRIMLVRVFTFVSYGVLFMDLATDRGLLVYIRRSQAGDHTALERLIDAYRPFIMKTAAQYSKRMLEWGHDDELSIGLMAFDSAVCTYDPTKKVPFLSYCRVVIINRLKDYTRTQVKQQAVPLDDQDLSVYLEGQIAQENYLKETIELERREEMERLEGILSDYSIGFEDLVEVSPRHRDSRQTLLQVARKLAHTDELWKFLIVKKQLPLNELERTCGVKRKTLERGRKFIIASAIIMANLDQFIHLSSYVHFN